jgi:hypothetical protein
MKPSDLPLKHLELPAPEEFTWIDPGDAYSARYNTRVPGGPNPDALSPKTADGILVLHRRGYNIERKTIAGGNDVWHYKKDGRVGYRWKGDVCQLPYVISHDPKMYAVHTYMYDGYACVRKQYLWLYQFNGTVFERTTRRDPQTKERIDALILLHEYQSAAIS